LNARATRRLALTLLLGTATCICSCRQLLEIEDAELAPTVAGSGNSSSGASGGGPAGSEGGASPAGGASDAGASGEATPGEGGRAPSLCDRYCEAVGENCNGAFAVYTSPATCQEVCKALPPGEPGAVRGNSVECRLHAALVAVDELAHYCPIAGPGGNGVCGDDCEALCQLRDRVCADFSTTDEATCARDCAKLPDLGTYSTDVKAGQYGGDHVQCRLYHVSAAATDDAEQHCRHVDGAAPCN
jgi:hypothetical protein